MDFNTEATRWLRVYLDIELQFWAHKNLILNKVGRVEDRVRRVAATKGLALGLVQWIQVVALQVVSLYGANIWWNG